MRYSVPGVAMALLSIAAAGWAGDTGLLEMAVAGTVSCKARPCWSEVMPIHEVQRALLDLAAASKTRAELETALAGTTVSPDDLAQLRLIRRAGGRYQLGFTLLTAAEPHARLPADAVLAQRAEIEAALSGYDAPGGDRKAVAFIVLGCFSLDWDALEFTARKGFRKAAVRRPDGRYIPWSEEKTELPRKREYSRSSSSWHGGLPMTAFGDGSPRNARSPTSRGSPATRFPSRCGQAGWMPPGSSSLSSCSRCATASARWMNSPATRRFPQARPKSGLPC